MSIHTYHSLAVRFYDESAYTDEEIKKLLISNRSIKEDLVKRVDILLIDETQDMAQDYYNLVRKFIQDTNSNPRIIVMGDRFQAIYEFKGANVKFLTLADKIWNLEFERLTLSTSYRLTNQIAWFVNNVMINKHRINTVKSGPPIDYYVGNSYQIYKKIGKQLRNMISKEGIKEEDIFILSPSIKSDEPPFKKLENYLVKHGLKCTTPISDDAKLDDKVISNKIVFTTYHQAKGRERKVVILYNFDDSYTQFFLKPNEKEIIKDPVLDYVHQSDYLDLEVIQKSEFKNVEDKYSILYIEDNKDLLDFVSDKFSTDYTFFLSDGTDAVDKALELIPDIIICDLNLPEMSGLQICEILKKDLRTSHIPIIIDRKSVV